MSYLRQVELENIAGYDRILWRSLQRDLNLLVGRNGAGKSTLLQALSSALIYVSRQRTEDLFRRTYPAGVIRLWMDGEPGPTEVCVSEMSKLRESREYRVLYMIENRQPKNIVGHLKNSLEQHSSIRYPHTLSELKRLAAAGGEDAALVDQVIEFARRVLGATEVDAVMEALRARNKLQARPASCGQFDALAFGLDLIRFSQSDAAPATSTFVLIDNPETYLHPACLDPLLTEVRRLVPHAQIVVSSHSLRLLCHRESKNVFWMERTGPQCDIQSVRELEGGARDLFLDLYGHDVSGAVLALLSDLSSPEYRKFLLECALPATIEQRDAPGADRQMQAVRDELTRSPAAYRILDVGAGHGDLLAALLDEQASAPITYYAADLEASPNLLERIEQGKRQALIAHDSAFVGDLANSPGELDAVVLCNVCHEVAPLELCRFLVQVLKLLRTGGRVVIHEVETLSLGEQLFIMWDSADYEAMFSAIPAVSVERRDPPRARGVPLATTVLRRIEHLPDDVEDRLGRAFAAHVPLKMKRTLDEVHALLARKETAFAEAMRQRRIAFLTAQYTHLGLLSSRLVGDGELRS